MKKFGRGFKFSVIILALFLVWLFVAPLLAGHLIVEKKLASADAILVLGGSSVYVERAHKAAELYKKGIAPKILLTDDGGRGGWSPSEQKNPRFADLARRALIEQGVAAEDIEILEPAVGGTIDEAELLRQNSSQKKLGSVVLVTSAYHTRRALWTFEKVLAGSGVAIGIEAVPPGIQTPPPLYWWLSELGWRLVAGEYVKAAYYRANY